MLVFVLAGIVKGIIGMGLPSVALGLLTLIFGLREAMVVLLLPALATNIYQAASGGALIALGRRFWPLLLAVPVGTWAGVSVLANANTALLNAGLGTMISVYALAVLMTPEFPSARPHESWLSPAIGLISGLLTGVTGTLGYPGLFYLQALRLKRDVLIQAMGLLFIISTVALAAAMAERQLIAAGPGGMSAIAVVPALAGMVAGRGIRDRIPEPVFRTMFLVALVVLGVAIIAKALVGPG